jgi:hypothetical protein
VQPLKNAAGEVTIDNNIVTLKLQITPAMRSKGIKSIGYVGPVMHDATHGQVLSIRVNKGQNASIKLEGRPELQSLIENYETIQNAKRDFLKKIAQKKRDDQKKHDKPLLNEMYREVELLRGKMPKNAVGVSITSAGNLDGIPLDQYEADGVSLPRSDVTILGVPFAIRPSAMSEFARHPVGYATHRLPHGGSGVLRSSVVALFSR